MKATVECCLGGCWAKTQSQKNRECAFSLFACDFGSLVSPHLRSQLFHVGIDLIQDVKALLEQCVLGTHEGQHLQETQGHKDGWDAPQGLYIYMPDTDTNKEQHIIGVRGSGLLTASRISNFFLAWSTLICQKQRGRANCRFEAACLRCVSFSAFVAAAGCQRHLRDSNGVGVFHLQHVVEGQVPEGFAAEDERLRCLFGLVHLVPRRMCVLHLGQLHVLAHPVKLLLGVLEFTHVPEERSQEHVGVWFVLLLVTFCMQPIITRQKMRTWEDNIWAFTFTF